MSGIVHCDLKPENVLWKYSIQADVVTLYLTDFGASQVNIKSEKVAARKNVTAHALSVAFAPPEVLENMTEMLKSQTVVVEISLSHSHEVSSTVGDAQPSRDIYALGIIMWEISSRQPCWQSIRSADIAQAVTVMRMRPQIDDVTLAFAYASSSPNLVA